MPIDPGEQREREQRRADVETEKAVQAHRKYIKTLNDEIDSLKKLGPLSKKQQDDLVELTKRVTETKDAHEKHLKIINEKIVDMDRESKGVIKLASEYNKLSQNMLVVAQSINKSLTSYHSYNIEIQKIVDLTGKFTKTSQSGIDAFTKMRSELNLTRQAGIEFGKVFSQINRMGIDTAKFTEGTKQLQKAFGQKGGVAMMGVAAGTKVSAPTLEAAMGGDQAAMAKAVRSATLEQTHALTRMTGGGGGLAGRGARFEQQAARVEKLKDDIQAGMSAALDLGLGPEIGALALPLAEINAKMTKLLLATMTNSGWLKTTLTTGGAVAGKGGDAMAALTGVPVKGGGMLAGLPGLGKVLKGGLLGAALFAGGTALHHYGEMAPEENKLWSKKAGLTYGGRMMQGAGIGAAVGSVIPGVGTALGAGIGVAVGGLTAAYERNKDRFDKWTDSWIDSANKTITSWVLGEEAVKNIDYENSLLALKTNAEGAAAALEGMANEMANLPEMLEFQIAQSRLPNALASMDPKPMEDYLEKASKAAAAAMLVSSSDLSASMGKVDLGIKSFENRASEARVNAEKATTPQEKEKFEKEAAKNLEGARTGRAEKAKLEAKIQEQMERINQMPAAAKVMEGVGMRKGFRGLETQAAEVGFEREFAGTGNVEEMGKLQEQRNAVYEANVKDLEKGNDQAKKALVETIERAESEKAGLAINDSRRNVLQNMADAAKLALAQQERTFNLEKNQLDLANQQTKIQTMMNQAMAATETVMFKRSQRAMALAKAQESFERERGGGPEAVGRYAGAQAQEAQTQLSAFLDTFNDRMGKLQQQLKVEGITGPQRMAIEMRIKDLADERVKLESQSLEARMHAATAEEHHRQELIGSSKQLAEIQRDTAAKMGLSVSAQMKYQANVIQASREDIESVRKEMAQMAEEIRNTPGGDPEKTVKYKQREVDLARKEADLIGQVMGKQRSFMEMNLANSFGIGGGTKVNPVVSSRVFGEQAQNWAGQMQALRPGERGLTFQQRQAKNAMDVMSFGGVGRGVPGPGGAPGLAPGEVLPGAAQPAGAKGGAQAKGFDVSGDIRVAVSLDNQLNLTATVQKLIVASMQGAGKPGSIPGMG